MTAYDMRISDWSSDVCSSDLALARVAIARDLFVISDEVYEYIAFDGHRHVSIASLPGMRERTVSMFAFTKAYAMDGWRLGYVARSEERRVGTERVRTCRSRWWTVY